MQVPSLFFSICTQTKIHLLLLTSEEELDKADPTPRAQGLWQTIAQDSPTQGMKTRAMSKTPTHTRPVQTSQRSISTVSHNCTGHDDKGIQFVYDTSIISDPKEPKNNYEALKQQDRKEW